MDFSLPPAYNSSPAFLDSRIEPPVESGDRGRDRGPFTSSRAGRSPDKSPEMSRTEQSGSVGGKGQPLEEKGGGRVRVGVCENERAGECLFCVCVVLQ